MGDKSPKQKNKKAQQKQQVSLDKSKAKQVADAARSNFKNVKK
jgi:hypothetical protein